MLKIKLARFGKKKQPHYRIVVNEARDKRDGKYVALLGHYAPTQIPKLLTIDLDAYKLWVKKGAQPTETVDSLIKRFESGTPFPERKARPSKKSKAKAAAEAEAKEAAKAAAEAESAQAAEVAAAPAEETAAAAETASEASEAAATESTETTPEAA